MLEADRPRVAHLPVLRGRDERADAVLDAPPAPPDDRPVDGRRRGGRAAEPSPPRPRTRRDVAPQTTLTHCSPMERTLILVKPDAFARGLTGEIIARFERKGLKIVAAKHMTVDRGSRQAALRRARRQARSSASSSSSSPPARSSRSSSRARTRSGRPPGDRRHQPARGHHRLDPRRLRDRGRHRTWSTAPTRPSPACAKPGCSSPSSRPADPRLWRARRRSGARSSSRSASRSTSASRASRRRPTATRSPSPRRTRAARPRRVAERARRSAPTRSSRRRRHPRQARRRGPGARVRRAPGRAHPPGRRRDRARPRRRASRHRRRDHPGPLPPGRRAALLDWYVAHRRVAGPRRRLRDPGRRRRRSSQAIEGDYLNVVGLPLARLLDLVPDLLPGYGAASPLPVCQGSTAARRPAAGPDGLPLTSRGGCAGRHPRSASGPWPKPRPALDREPWTHARG